MPQCQSCFLLFFGFRKVVLKIFSELDETKSEVPIFPTRTRSPKERRRGAAGRRPHTSVQVGPLPRHPMGSGPRASTDVAPSPINSPRRENPKTPSHYSRKHPLSPPPSTLTRGVQKFSSGTLQEREIVTGGLYIAMPASEVMHE